jgi:hypothetical protein
MMADDLNAYKAQAIAQDRLNTLVSVMFDDADLSWDGEDINFSGNAVKMLIKAWHPETYNDVYTALKEKKAAKLAGEVKADE